MPIRLTIDATGPLMTLRSKFAGWSFYLKDGPPAAMVATDTPVTDAYPAANHFQETSIESMYSSENQGPEGKRHQMWINAARHKN